MLDPTIAREKLQQAKGYLKESDFDAWILLSREGSDPAVPLLTGVSTVGLAAFILYADGSDEAIVANFDAGHVEAARTVERVVPYHTGPGEALQQALMARGVRRVALNYAVDDALCDGLTHGLYQWFVAQAPLGVEIGSAEPLLAMVRGVKLEPEIERLRRACKVTDEIYDLVRPQLRVGMSERQISALFREEVRKRGLAQGTEDSFEAPMVLIPRVGMSHRNPTDAVLEPGDMLVVDFSVVVDGYASDIARTFYCLREGERSAPEEVASMFRASRLAIERAAEALRPGVKGWEVDAVARATLREAGFPEITHALGHQVGQRAHDGGMILGPRWERYGKSPYGTVAEGMVFALEPTILPPGPRAVLTEENVVVRAHGIEPLGKWQDDLWLIG